SCKKALCASIFLADIFRAHDADSGSPCRSRSLPEAIVAEPVPRRLIPAVLPGQGLQRAIGSKRREAAALPVGIDQGERLGAEIAGRSQHDGRCGIAVAGISRIREGRENEGGNGDYMKAHETK